MICCNRDVSIVTSLSMVSSAHSRWPVFIRFFTVRIHVALVFSATLSSRYFSTEHLFPLLSKLKSRFSCTAALQSLHTQIIKHHWIFNFPSFYFKLPPPHCFFPNARLKFCTTFIWISSTENPNIFKTNPYSLLFFCSHDRINLITRKSVCHAEISSRSYIPLFVCLFIFLLRWISVHDWFPCGLRRWTIRFVEWSLLFT